MEQGLAVMSTASETKEALEFIERAKALGVERKGLRDLLLERFRRVSKPWKTRHRVLCEASGVAILPTIGSLSIDILRLASRMSFNRRLSEGQVSPRGSLENFPFSHAFL